MLLGDRDKCGVVQALGLDEGGIRFQENVVLLAVGDNLTLLVPGVKLNGLARGLEEVTSVAYLELIDGNGMSRIFLQLLQMLHSAATMNMSPPSSPGGHSLIRHTNALHQPLIHQPLQGLPHILPSLWPTRRAMDQD